MENPKNLATQGTQDEEKQSKNNPEKLATQGTQDEEKQNKNNPEKLATQGTQDEEKQSKDTTRYVLDTTIHKTKKNKAKTQHDMCWTQNC